MATIEILDHVDAEEGDPKIMDKIEIEEIEALHVSPVTTRLGNLIPMTQLAELVSEIKPIEQLTEERDRYYAQNVPVCEDGDRSNNTLDIPHYIGLRIVLESVLRKYGTDVNLHIRIS